MKPLRVFLLIILAVVALGSLYFLQQWNKPHRDPDKEKGIVLTTAQLLDKYKQNEHAADSLYLNKTIEVTGTVQEWGVNDSHQPTALFRSDDPMMSVFCTFRDTTIAAKDTSKPITVKGICSGLVSDVKLTECVLKQ